MILIKKTFLFVYILLTTISYINSQSLVLSLPVDVAIGYDNLRPRIVLTQNDIPLLMWGGAGTNPIYVSRYNGTSFDTPLQVNPVGLDPFCASWTGPDIAANGDDVWVVFNADINGFRVYSMKSSDGGVSFADTVLAGDYSGLNRFASIGIDSLGNPIIIYMNHGAGWSNPDYVVTNSPDAGLTWNPSISVSSGVTGYEVCDCCPAEMIANTNYQIAMFRNNDNNLRDIWASSSSDGGATFNGNDIDLASWNIYACPSSGPHGIIRGDSLLATWMTSGSGQSRVMLGISNIINGVIASNVEISPSTSSGVIQNYPRIAGDDLVYGIVYQEYSSGNYDVYMSYSLNGNSEIETRDVMLNDETLGNQINPDIVYSNGVFHIVFQDDKTHSVKYLTATISPVNDQHKFDNKISISVYPNPCKGSVQIDIPEVIFQNHVQLIVSDVSGKTIKIIPIENYINSSIDLCLPFDKGVYFISFILDGNIQDVLPIIIE